MCNTRRRTDTNTGATTRGNTQDRRKSGSPTKRKLTIHQPSKQYWQGKHADKEYHILHSHPTVKLTRPIKMKILKNQQRNS
jgi:hypothetical protein